jgi:hypothetical protein
MTTPKPQSGFAAPLTKASQLRSSLSVRCMPLGQGVPEDIVHSDCQSTAPRSPVLPLAEAARAHKEVLEPGAGGKIVLVC